MILSELSYCLHNEAFSVKWTPCGAEHAMPAWVRHEAHKKRPPGTIQHGKASGGMHPHVLASSLSRAYFWLAFLTLFYRIYRYFPYTTSSSERKASYALPHWHADL